MFLLKEKFIVIEHRGLEPQVLRWLGLAPTRLFYFEAQLISIDSGQNFGTRLYWIRAGVIQMLDIILDLL